MRKTSMMKDKTQWNRTVRFFTNCTILKNVYLKRSKLYSFSYILEELSGIFEIGSEIRCPEKGGGGIHSNIIWKNMKIPLRHRSPTS